MPPPAMRRVLTKDRQRLGGWFNPIHPLSTNLNGCAPPSLVREIAVTVAVAVAVAVMVAVAASAGVASAGVAFIDSSDGIHIVQKIVLEDGTDANKPLKKRTCGHSTLREVGSMGGVL
jgi:hypothetical protein